MPTERFPLLNLLFAGLSPLACDPVVFAWRPFAGLLQVGLKKTILREPPKDRIDRSLGDLDALGDALDQLIAVPVLGVHQGQDAEFDDAFIELRIHAYPLTASTVHCKVLFTEKFYFKNRSFKKSQKWLLRFPSAALTQRAFGAGSIFLRKRFGQVSIF